CLWGAERKRRMGCAKRSKNWPLRSKCQLLGDTAVRETQARLGQRHVLEFERDRHGDNSSRCVVHQLPIAELAQGQLLVRLIAEAIADDRLAIALVVGFVTQVGRKLLLDA